MLASVFKIARRLWHRLTYQPPKPTDRVAYLVGWETAKHSPDDEPNPYPEGTEKHNSWHWGFHDARSDSRNTW